MGIKEDDLIKYLDAFMSGNGGSIKPIMNDDGDMTFITAEETDASKAGNESVRAAEAAFGERERQGHALFSDDVDDDCPSCANIPNIGDDFDDLWEEKSRKHKISGIFIIYH